MDTPEASSRHGSVIALAFAVLFAMCTGEKTLPISHVLLYCFSYQVEFRIHWADLACNNTFSLVL